MNDTTLDVRHLGFNEMNGQSRMTFWLYPLAWLLILLLGHTVMSAEFIAVNSALIAVTTAIRGWHGFHPKRPRSAAAGEWLTFAVLGNAVQWGGMVTWALLDPALAPLQTPLLLSAACMAGGSTHALAARSLLRIVFPSVLLGPVCVAMLLQGDRSHQLTAVLMLLYLAYILVAGKRQQRNYLEALNTAALLRQRTRELEHISFTDPVTQLRNRSYFDLHFELEWRRAHRQGYPLALLMIDLDHFKRINDRYGHLFGDECLGAVAARLQSLLQRSGDLLARVGGEEFALLLINTSEQGARCVARQVCDAIRGIELTRDGEKVAVTTSVGLAVVVPDSPFGDAAQQFMHRADTALYQAKRLGRDRVCAHVADDVPAQVD